MPLNMYTPPKPSLPLENVKYVVAVAAGKGGVGKSSVTVNLARALKRAGYAVGVMDTDIYGPSVRKMLAEDQMPEQKGDLIFPAICDGIRMISMAYFRRDFEAAAVRAPIANGVIQQFIKNVQWGTLDFLLIDFPPGTGDIQLTLAQQAQLTGAVLVTTPQDVALLDVRRAADLFDQVRIPVIGVVENMSYYLHAPDNEKIYLFGKGGGERLAAEIGAPFLGSIPIDPGVCRSGDEGSALAEDSSAYQAFALLSDSFLNHLTLMQQGHLSSFDLVWKDMS